MKVKLISEEGTVPALFGLGLSYGITSSMQVSEVDKYLGKMYTIACKLAHKDEGHNKFLRQITLSFDISANRGWWIQFDQYKVGVVTQSESTMHTLMKRPLLVADFDEGVPDKLIWMLEDIRKSGDKVKLKRCLPEGYIQRRIVTMNYQVLREIWAQRRSHEVPEWKAFIDAAMAQIGHPEWVRGR